MILFISCGDDNNEVVDSIPTTDGEANQAPLIQEKSFVVSEDVGDSFPIGAVEANDPDGDPLFYSISENSNSLFEITEDGGVITLKNEQSLDFETATNHELLVKVSDGTLTSEAIITIEVTDVDENSAPTITENQTFSTSEFILDSYIIGVVSAEDEDVDDILTFSIIENQDNLFEISGGGEISLQKGKQLEYSQKSSHVVLIEVSDNKSTATANVEITVEDVDDNAFVTVWETTNLEIKLPLYLPSEATNTDYNFIVDWGDGTEGEVTSFNDEDASHLYTSDGEYIVTILGKLVGFNNKLDGPSKGVFKDVLQWGDVQLGNDGAVFANTGITKFSAIDAPDLSNITNMHNFFGWSQFDGDIGHWDVSNITDMSGMFQQNRAFNQDIGGWNVSNVTNMQGMFHEAYGFNQNIGGWDVSNVTNMNSMFYGFGGTSSFNQNLSNWDVGNVTDMADMFKWAVSFNGNIGDWDVSQVSNMNGMFTRAISFNQDIGNWNVGNVTDMSNMFNYAIKFNQNISTWDVSSVVRMDGMFRDAHTFNQNIGGWDVTNVTFIYYMLFDAFEFNQDISDWNTINVKVSSCYNFTSNVTPIHASDKLPSLGPCFEN
ncbi:MAG: BspA family leucine-rich repeat surface protein [Bacteroidota bacterium]